MRKFFTLFVAALCCATIFATNTPLPGKFTINADGDQVRFSPGPYSTNNAFGGHKDMGQLFYPQISWFYLSWGTGDDYTFYGVKETFTDWGVNTIYDDTEGNLWRTLSADELQYILSGREHAESLCGMVTITIEDVDWEFRGLVLFPDEAYDMANSDGRRLDFSNELHMYTYKDGNKFAYSVNNKYTHEQWKQLEAAGAVFLQEAAVMVDKDFLPGGDLSFDKGVMSVKYWTSTPSDDSKAKALVLSENMKLDNGLIIDLNRYFRIPVRLVKDVDPSEGIENIATPTDKARKVMMGGTLYIATPDGKIYNAQGAEVK